MLCKTLPEQTQCLVPAFGRASQRLTADRRRVSVSAYHEPTELDMRVDVHHVAERRRICTATAPSAQARLAGLTQPTATTCRRPLLAGLLRRLQLQGAASGAAVEHRCGAADTIVSSEVSIIVVCRNYPLALSPTAQERGR